MVDTFVSTIILSLQWELVSDGLKNSFRHRPIPIDHQLYGLLNAKPRIIPVGGNQKKGIPSTMTKTEFIFHSSTGGMMSPTNWCKRNYKSFMAAVIADHPEVPFLTPHELRTPAQPCGKMKASTYFLWPS